MNNRYLSAGLAPELIEVVNNKVKSLISRKHFNADDFDDLQQELFIALWQGLKAYEQQGKNIVNEKAFAQFIVNKRAQDLIDKAKAQRRKSAMSTVSLHDSIGSDDNYLLIDSISETHTFNEDINISFADHIEYEIDLQTIISQLPSDLQELYKLTQIMNISEIAKLKNLSRKTIHKKITLLKRKISDFI